MKESTKRSIYYELATHDVVKQEEKTRFTGIFDGWSYTFGKYRVHHDGDTYTRIYEYNPDIKHFVIMNDAGWWDEDRPKNTTYEIYIAAKNKATGKPYIDPYKIPAKDAIQDSQQRFVKQMSENASNFLPYDTPKDLRQKIIAQMKQVLTRHLNDHYNGKEH